MDKIDELDDIYFPFARLEVVLNGLLAKIRSVVNAMQDG